MKAYSISQGKVIDVPDNAQVLYRPKTTVAPTQVTSPSVSSGAGTPITPSLTTRADVIKAMQNDPINAQKYKVILDSMPEEPGQAPTKEPTAAQTNADMASKAAEGITGQLEKMFNLAEGGKYKGTGARLYGVQKNVAGVLGLDDPANRYNAVRKGGAATLKTVTGDVGVLTKGDYQRIVGMLPDMGATPGEAELAFNSIRELVANKFQTKLGKTTYKAPQGQGGLLDFLSDATLGTAKNIAQDVGAGINANITNKSRLQSNEAGLSQAEKIAQQAMQTEDMAQRSEMLKQANEILAGISESEGDISRSFSKDIQDPYLLRGAGAGAEIATLAGGVNAASKIPSKVKGGFSLSKNLIEKRALVAKDVQVSADKIVKAGDKYVSDMNPAAAKAWAELKPAVQKTKDLPSLLEKITDWGNQAYTKAGDVKSVDKGLLRDYLYKAGREVVREVSPEAAKLTEQISKRIALEGLLKKLAVPALVTSGVGAMGYGLISNLINKNKSY